MTTSLMNDLFTLPIPILEKILRPILVYLLLLAMLRVFGKRELAQLNPFDLTVLLMLSNTVQNAIIGNDNSLVGGLIGALTLLATNYAVVRFVFGHRRLDQVIGGEPTVLIQDGQIVQKAMRKELVTESQLQVAANRQGIGDLGDVQKCVLEAGGVFLFEQKSDARIDPQLAALNQKVDGLSAQLQQLIAKTG